MKRVLALALALAAVGAASLLAVAARPDRAVAQAPAGEDSITVTGTGTVTAVPGEAQLSFGVETRRPSAQAAVAANADAMRKVIAALREAGARDLTTQWVSVYPVTADDGSTTGYAASNTVSATSDVADAAKLIDVSAAAGANQISGPGFSAKSAKALQREALSRAVADARLRAEALANAAGRSLGRMTQVVEAGAEPQPLYDRAAVAAESTPIEPGRQEITASVSVTFSLA